MQHLVQFRKVMVVVALAMATACTRHNPAVCCTTPAECEELGVDDVRPCEGFKVCIDGNCVSPTCSSSAECSDPTPYCVNQVCSPTCSADPDCVGISGLPYCSPEGACVACLDSSQCEDPGAAVCDDATYECRPCVEDVECASGVCLSLEGTCAVTDDVVYVSTSGTDSGDCPSGAPCRTIQYGLNYVTAQRRVLRLVDSDFSVPDGVNLDRDVYLDTASTRMSRTSVGPIITVDTPSTVTVEGIRIVNTSVVLSIDVNTQADVTLNAIDVTRGSISVGGAATLRVMHSHFTALSNIACQSRVEVDDSTFEAQSTVTGNYCVEANIHHNRFLVAVGRAIAMTHSTAQIENNLVVVQGSTSPEIAVTSTASPQGSNIRFNTFASEGSGTGSAMSCGFGDTATSNIFAWQSPNALYSGSACTHTYSLFDAAAGAVPGAGNVTGVASGDVFVAPANGDYHPASDSGALGAAEAGLDVSDDLMHSPRPAPAGSTPDIGAYEMP
jgi:hypothetical protein